MFSQPDINEEVSVWVEHLTFAAILSLVVLYFREGAISVRYIKFTCPGLCGVYLLERIGILTSKAIRVPFTRPEHLNDSESGIYRLQVMNNKFAEKFILAHESTFRSVAYPDSRVNPNRIVANLRQVAATYNYELLAFAYFAFIWHKNNGVGVKKFYVVSANAVLANSIPAGWVDFEVFFICPWNLRHSLIARLGLALSQMLFEIRRPRRRIPAGPATVATTAHFYGFDSSVSINDVHWWWNSNIPADRVVICFEQPDKAAKREVVADAEKLGFKCVVFKPNAIGDSPHLLWRRAPGPIVAIRRFFWKIKVICWGIFQKPVERWIGCRFIDMLYTSERMEDFMREFNVRAFFHRQDSDFDYVSLACDMIGGARIGDQWSSIHWPAAYHIRMHQVFFAWGQKYADIVSRVGSCSDYLLLSGCIVKGNQSELDVAPAVREAATGLRSHGASRILTIFDTSLPCDQFYRFFMQHIIDDKRWGLLIKPKDKPLSGHMFSLPEDETLFQKAISTGRVHLLNNSISAVDAAAVADFSVSAGINSAAVVSALAGHRAIQLDTVRMHESGLSEWASFYQKSPYQLVFTDAEKLWSTLNQYFDRPQDYESLGKFDHSQRNTIDPFQDGKASGRIGEYVAWFLDALDQGMNRDKALRDATDRYAMKWGSDKVIRRVK